MLTSEPAWLTDEVKIKFANAVAMWLARGGSIKVGSLGIPDFFELAESDRVLQVLLDMVFPDGEHNIIAWIASLKGSDNVL